MIRPDPRGVDISALHYFPVLAEALRFLRFSRKRPAPPALLFRFDKCLGRARLIARVARRRPRASAREGSGLPRIRDAQTSIEKSKNVISRRSVASLA